MRLVDVLDSCCVKTVTVAPEVSLAVAARAMHQADAAAAMVMENGKLQGILTAGDILRTLTLASSVNLAWNGPVTAVLAQELPTVFTDDKIGQVIEKMAAAEIDYLPVITGLATQVVSLCRLLQAQKAFLHGEVDHLQTYIDALHDAPND